MFSLSAPDLRHSSNLNRLRWRQGSHVKNIHGFCNVELLFEIAKFKCCKFARTRGGRSCYFKIHDHLHFDVDDVNNRAILYVLELNSKVWPTLPPIKENCS